LLKEREMMAVILAAGEGRRFFPLSAYVPKELVPLGRRPIIEWVVQEVVGAGIEEIILVSAARKAALERLFRRLADEYGFRARIVRQDVPRGTADAVLRARRHLHEPFFVYYADEVWLGESRARQLRAAYESLGCPAVLLPVFRVEDQGLLARLSAVEVREEVSSGLYSISRVIEKPLPGSAPSELAVVSGIVLEPPMLEEIAVAVKEAAADRGEVYLTDAISWLLHRWPVYALEPKGEWVDVGTIERYPEAFVRVALAEGGEEFRGFLKSVVQ